MSAPGWLEQYGLWCGTHDASAGMGVSRDRLAALVAVAQAAQALDSRTDARAYLPAECDTLADALRALEATP